MPDHKITPELLVASRPRARAAGRRPSLTARVAARFRAGRYDRLLAVGVVPQSGSALAAHRTRLTSTAERHVLAGSLRQAVRDAKHTARAVGPDPA